MEHENQFETNEIHPETNGGKQKENISFLLSVFISPMETFNKYRENQKFAWKLVILLFISAILGLLSAHFVFQDPELSGIEEIPGVSEGLINTIGLISGFFGGAVVVGVAIIITCFFLWILASITTTDVSFKQLFAIYVVASVPSLIAGIIQIAAMSQGNYLDYAVTSLGFLAQDTTSFLSQIFFGIELFSIWTTILLGIGIAIFAKVSMKKGMILAFIYWIGSLLVVSTITWFISNLSFV